MINMHDDDMKNRTKNWDKYLLTENFIYESNHRGYSTVINDLKVSVIVRAI